MRIKFSLRAVMIAISGLAILAAFTGWRYNQRQRLKTVAERIEKLGGEVFYSWQSPRVVKVPANIYNVCHYVVVPYAETLTDGSQVIKTRTEISHQNRGIGVMTEEFRATNNQRPTFKISEFLIGSHNDVSISAVSFPANEMNENTLQLLHASPKLEKILLRVEASYIGVQRSTRISEEVRERTLEKMKMGIKLQQATSLIKENLPNVKLHSNGLCGEDNKWLNLPPKPVVFSELPPPSPLESPVEPPPLPAAK